MPADTPVTNPPNTVAEVLLRLHTPPATASDNIIGEPTHTDDGPVIVPAPDAALTVIVLVAGQPAAIV